MSTYVTHRHRPNVYQEEYSVLVYKLKLLGMTDEELAKFFDIALNTFHLWLSKYTEFKIGYLSGGDLADADIIGAMHKSAMGYSHPAEKIMVVDKTVVREEYIEHYPPNPKAAEMLVYNRQRSRWKPKPDEETSANINIKITGGLPDE